MSNILGKSNCCFCKDEFGVAIDVIELSVLLFKSVEAAVDATAFATVAVAACSRDEFVDLFDENGEREGNARESRSLTAAIKKRKINKIKSPCEIV